MRRLAEFFLSMDAEDHDVTLVSPTSPRDVYFKAHRIRKRSLILRVMAMLTLSEALQYRLLFASLWPQIKKMITTPDLIVIADVEFLPLLQVITDEFPRARVCVDLYENYLGSPSKSPVERLYFWMFKSGSRFLTDRRIGVSCPEERTATSYELALTREVQVLRNSRFSHEFNCPPARKRDGLRLVHHGFLFSNRALEIYGSLLRSYVSDASLTIFTPSGFGRRALVRLRFFDLWISKRFRVRGPVSYAELPSQLGKFDFGLCIIRGDDPNSANSLPNKFFDYVAAGIPFVSGPGQALLKFGELLGQPVVGKAHVSDLALVVEKLDQATLRELQKKLLDRRSVLGVESDIESIFGRNAEGAKPETPSGESREVQSQNGNSQGIGK